MHYYLSLGANLGHREQTIREAIEYIEQQIGHVRRCSSFYYSTPWGFVSEHDFCNVCCLLESDQAPIDVLHATQAIERQLGRTKKSENGQYEDRTIDIDIIRILDNGTEVYIDSEELRVPHPYWQERDFVKNPLNEII